MSIESREHGNQHKVVKGGDGIMFPLDPGVAMRLDAVRQLEVKAQEALFGGVSAAVAKMNGSVSAAAAGDFASANACARSPRRKEILETAMSHVTEDRQSTHGKPEQSFQMIASLWSAYLGREVSAVDVTAMMALLKVARLRDNPGHADNWVDLAGYAACGGELALASDA